MTLKLLTTAKQLIVTVLICVYILHYRYLCSCVAIYMMAHSLYTSLLTAFLARCIASCREYNRETPRCRTQRATHPMRCQPAIAIAFETVGFVQLLQFSLVQLLRRCRRVLSSRRKNKKKIELSAKCCFFQSIKC